ncbi:unnamed protein product [Boreogadus saida]
MLKGDVGRRPATDWPESVTKSRERHGNHADKTEDQELEPGNLEDDVVLKDTIQAAAWCQLQSFKDSVSLLEVIGMEGWEQMAASTQRKSHDGGDEEETWKPFQFSFRLHTDYELFCVEMMDRRNLKVFASFESNTSPPPRPPSPSPSL